MDGDVCGVVFDGCVKWRCGMDVWDECVDDGGERGGGRRRRGTENDGGVIGD